MYAGSREWYCPLWFAYADALVWIGHLITVLVAYWKQGSDQVEEALR